MADARTDLIIRARQEMTDAIKGFEDLKKKLTGVEKNLDKLEKSAKVTANKMTVAFKKAGVGLTKASNRIGGAFRGMLGQATAVLGTAGIVGLFVKAAKSASDFETELRKVSTLFKGDAARSMEILRKEVMALSRETGESVETLSGGLFDIVSAGVKGSETVAGASKLLKVASKAAIGGFTDTGTAVDILTTLLNSYKKTTEEAASMSDKLITIARLGKTTFSEMAPELGKVTSVAAAAGISMDELGGAIVELTKGGRRINFAMTDFRAIVTGVLKPTKDLQALFKQAGFESGEAALKARGFAGVMEMIGRVSGGSAAKLLKFIPQQEALAGAAILASSNVDALRKSIGEVGGSVGATEEAYDKMSDTFEFKTKRFRALLDETFIKLGKAILPVIIEKLEAFSKWVSKNSDEIVVFFKDVFLWFTKFGEFVLDHGEKIAYTLGTIWAVGKISTFLTKLKGIATLMASGGVLGIGLGLFATGLGVATAAAALLASKLKDVKEEAKKMVDAMHEASTGLTLEILGPETRKGFEIAERFFKQAIDLAEKGTPGAIGLFWGQEAAAEKEIDAMIARLKEGLVETRKLAAGEASAIEEELKEATKQAFLRAGGEEEDFFWAPKAVGRKYEAIVKAKIDDLESMKNELEYAAETMGRKAREVIEKPVDVPGLVVVSEEQIKARAAALKRIRALEIAAMEEIEKVRAVLEDKIAAIRANKLTGAGLKNKEIALLRVQAEKLIEGIGEKRVAKIAKVEEKAAKERMAIEEENRKRAIKHTQDRIALLKKADEVTARAAKDVQRMMEENAKRAETIALNLFKVRKEKQDELQANFEAHLERAVSILQSAGETLLNTMDSLWGRFYDKAFGQFRELFDLAFEAAGEGVTVGEGGVAERPTDRLTTILDKMITWWENMASNLDGVLNWLTKIAVPRLVEAIISSLPKIFQALNSAWREFLPDLIDMIVDNIGTILQELPDIAESIIAGVVDAIKRLVERLPEFLSSVFAFLTDSLVSLTRTVNDLVINAIPEVINEIIAQTPAIVVELVKELAVNLIPEMAKAIGRAIKDALKNLVGIGGTVRKFGRGVKKAFGFHEGGMIGQQFADNVAAFGAAVKAHDGMFMSPRLAADEVPVIAQMGEAVLSRAGVAAAGGEGGVDALNAGVGGQTTHNNIVQVQYLFGEQVEDVIDRLQGESIRKGTGAVAGAINRDRISGFAAKA